jgi:hypothetical protein
MIRPEKIGVFLWEFIDDHRYEKSSYENRLDPIINSGN